MEMTIKDTLELHGVTGGAEKVNKMHESTDKKQGYRCGKANHATDDCYFKNTKCNNCGKIDHIYRKCKQEKVQKKKRNQDQKSKQQNEKRKTKVFAMAEDGESDSDVESDSDSRLFYLYRVNSERSKFDAIWLRPRINDVKLKMELDTGPALSIISKRDYRRYFNTFKSIETPIHLKTYTGKIVNPLGILNVTAKHNGQSETMLPLYVVQNGGPLLFGRDW